MLRPSIIAITIGFAVSLAACGDDNTKTSDTKTVTAAAGDQNRIRDNYRGSRRRSLSSRRSRRGRRRPTIRRSRMRRPRWR